MTDPQSVGIWRRSRRCDSCACVEVAHTGGGFAVRDSTRPDTVLSFSAAEWKTFVAGVRNGDFDRMPS